MKVQYVVRGTNKVGDKVRLYLGFYDAGKRINEDGMGMMAMINMAKNMELIQEEMQQKAVLMQQPDTLTIPYDEWKRYQYKIDDIIWVEITSNEMVE